MAVALENFRAFEIFRSSYENVVGNNRRNLDFRTLGLD